MTVGYRAALLERAAHRVPLHEHDGRSGASLERVVLDDGTRLIVKTASPVTDLPMRATGDLAGRELTLWSAGILSVLPAGVEHAILDGWHADDGSVVTVMRDLGEQVLGRRRRLSRRDCRSVLSAAAAVHRRFAGVSVDGLCTLEDRLTLFAPDRMARVADGSNPLPMLVAKGWEVFADQVPGDVADAVFAVFDNPVALAAALRRAGSTLIHGDLWLVNIAFDGDSVVLLDWGLASDAPPAVEFASFLAGNASSVRASREAIIDDFRRLSGELHDEVALDLALVGGLAELGWNKALDAATHTDEVIRARERKDLGWWVTAARAALHRNPY
jgi:hypothetical protein